MGNGNPREPHGWGPMGYGGREPLREPRILETPKVEEGVWGVAGRAGAPGEGELTEHEKQLVDMIVNAEKLPVEEGRCADRFVDGRDGLRRPHAVSC